MRFKFHRHSLAAILLTLSATSCANFTSISRTKHTFGKGQVHFTDAKQRAIIMQRFAEYPEDDKEHPYWIYRYCSEPAPDVFSVLATSVAAELSGTKTAEQKQLAAKMAIAMAESGATIERTQTINLLRLSMYSTCERYLNGALTQNEFVIQAARDQRAMVAILAIEQLTGTVRPPSTILNANASGFSSSKPEEVIAAIKTAKDSVDAAEAEVTKLSKEHEALQALPACPDETLASEDTTAAEPATEETASDVTSPDTPADELAAENTVEESRSEPSCAKPADVEAKADELEAAKGKLSNAEEYYDTAVAVAGNGSTGLGVYASADGRAGPGVDTTPGDRAAIADTVLKIVDSTFSDQSELTFVCMVRLRDKPPATRSTDELYTRCAELIGAQIDIEVKKLEKTSAEFIAQAYVQRFDQVWSSVAPIDAVDSTKLNDAINRANRACGNCINAFRIRQLQAANDKASLQSAFNQLPSPASEALVESLK